jgi:hypothetical protein
MPAVSFLAHAHMLNNEVSYILRQYFVVRYEGVGDRRCPAVALGVEFSQVAGEFVLHRRIHWKTLLLLLEACKTQFEYSARKNAILNKGQ